MLPWQKSQPDTLFFQHLELTGYHIMALTGPKVLGFFPWCWTRRSCRCSAPLTAGLCSCLWRCLLRFEGLPPPARPSVRPILDAAIKHPLPQKSSWGLCAHSYTPSPAGSRLQLWHLLHEPFNTWHLPHSKFWIKWILQNLCLLSNRSPLSGKENTGGEKETCKRL